MKRVIFRPYGGVEGRDERRRKTMTRLAPEHPFPADVFTGSITMLEAARAAMSGIGEFLAKHLQGVSTNGPRSAP